MKDTKPSPTIVKPHPKSSADPEVIHLPSSLPGKSLRTYALAAVGASIPGAGRPDDEIPERRFLLEHLNAVDPGRKGWARNLPSYLDNPRPVDRPLFRLSRELGLTVFEMLAAALAVSVEEDVMAGRTIAYAQAPLGGSRPLLGLLSTALAGAVDGNQRLIDEIVTGAAVKSGLLELLDEGAPLPERAVRAPTPICLALNGFDGEWPGTHIGMGDLPGIPLPDSISREAERQAAALPRTPERLLTVRAGSMGEGKSVAAAIAEALNLRPLFIETDKTSGLGPWLVLRRLLPVFCLELGPGERWICPPLPYFRGAVLAILGPDGSVETPGGAAADWTIPTPAMEERRALWQIALNNDHISDALARVHRHRSGRIADLGRLARRYGVLNGREQPSAEDILKASRSGLGAGLDALAIPLPEDIPDKAMVMSKGLHEDLEALLMRCRCRDGLDQGLGPSAAARYRPGVRTLLVGPSGSGKTLTAGWVATRLGLPLFRVDLASVSSKYIGETEKNLAQLLARAEQTEVVLLFDEADSLFGKRTEVNQANDRFANAQTNYLLQRIETYDGVTILTSNSRSRFDPAFTRRLDLIIDFPVPGPRERRRLWKSHLGANHRLTKGELNRLAGAADLTGGSIRNVVLAAAAPAREENRPIAYADILVGLKREYKKNGRQTPVELKRGHSASPVNSLR